MKPMTPEEIRNEYSKTYDKGVLNHAIRAWYYLQKGLQLMNEFKYLIAGILAFYYTLKLESFWWIIILFVVAIPILVFVGYFHTHKMSKAIEWTNMVFASYFSRYGMDLAEKNVDLTSENVKLLKEIRDELKRQNDLYLTPMSTIRTTMPIGSTTDFEIKK